MSLPKELARGTVMPIVLSLLAERPMYGYEIVKTVNARSGGVLEFKEGTLYPLLHQMQGKRLVKAKWQRGDGSGSGGSGGGGGGGGGSNSGGKARKYYALTPKGSRLLGESRTQWSELRGAVDALLMGA